LDSVNLIRLFDFYLASMFLLGLYRRRSVYWDAARLGFSLVGRRQKLLTVVKSEKRELLTLETLRPVLIAIALMLIQWLCSRLIWPRAEVPLGGLVQEWWKPVLVTAAFVPMFAVDIYFLVRIGQFDHGETEKYLDQAERWLGTWKATAVHTLTFGIVNPNAVVQSEVRKNLQELGRTVQASMWWASVQTGLRLTFGAVVWLLWAFG
jgi:hypothetical protein